MTDSQYAYEERVAIMLESGVVDAERKALEDRKRAREVRETRTQGACSVRET